ncbi:transmembrane protein 70, mitochondrial [Colossoma macropomum]|uniref:transmembrane protein 70, mitochondrial n=1 Tax=Colossoma macropomum TaxID=42526 RepID=UPI001864E5C9|nr:transmembrane protein 70, mitochondrial [Colossoma macropomum]
MLALRCSGFTWWLLEITFAYWLVGKEQKMYQISVLPGLRYISRKPHRMWRTVHCRGVHLLNETQQSKVKSLTCSLHLNRELLLNALRRTFSKAGVNKVQPYTYGRCFSSQPVSPEDGVLIYSGNLGKAVLGVKFFSYSTSMFSLCVMPYVLTKTGLGVSSLAMKVAFCGFIGFFTFLTPLLLHLITKGYVVRLYHNKDTDMYTAVTYSALLVEKKTVFHQSDVKIPDVSRMFTSFYAKKRSMLVNPMLFELPHDYNHLMGYDQPFSFDLDDLKKPDKS